MLDDIHILFPLVLHPTISEPFLYFEMEAQFDIPPPQVKRKIFLKNLFSKENLGIDALRVRHICKKNPPKL